MDFQEIFQANFAEPSQHSTISIPNALPEEVAEYPSQWFVGKRKPILNVFKTKIGLEDMARQVAVIAA